MTRCETCGKEFDPQGTVTDEDLEQYAGLHRGLLQIYTSQQGPCGDWYDQCVYCSVKQGSWYPRTDVDIPYKVSVGMSSILGLKVKLLKESAGRRSKT